MFVEVATSIRGLVQQLAALAKTNVVDCQENAALRAELERRCGARERMIYKRARRFVKSLFDPLPQRNIDPAQHGPAIIHSRGIKELFERFAIGRE